MAEVKIVTRPSWGAETPISVSPRPFPLRYVFCMNTMTSPCYDKVECMDSVRDLQRHQMKTKNYRDIRFNFLIGGTGFILEGRGWDNEPMLPFKYGRYNRPTLLLGFVGKFKENTLPPELAAARESFVLYGIKQGFIAQGYRSYQIFDEAPFDDKDSTFID